MRLSGNAILIAVAAHIAPKALWLTDGQSRAFRASASSCFRNRSVRCGRWPGNRLDVPMETTLRSPLFVSVDDPGAAEALAPAWDDVLVVDIVRHVAAQGCEDGTHRPFHAWPQFAVEVVGR